MISDTVKEEMEALVAVALAGQTTDSEPEEAPSDASEGETAVESQAATDGEPAEEVIPAGTPQVVDCDYKAKGYHLDVTVLPGQVADAAAILDKNTFFIEAVTGVDWLADEQMEVVYDFKHLKELYRVVIRTRLDRAAPCLPTISDIFPGANWHERETHDFFGIVFEGHPDLSPLLLPEDADFHPLLKDYQP